MLQDQNNDEQNDENDIHSADTDNDTSSCENLDPGFDNEGGEEESGEEDVVGAAPEPVAKKGKSKGKGKKAATDKPKKEAAKKKVADKPASEVQNGVTRPQKGTTSANVWDIADAANRTKAGAVRKTILEKAAAKGINGATAATQFARWRTFNGLTQAKVAEAATE